MNSLISQGANMPKLPKKMEETVEKARAEVGKQVEKARAQVEKQVGKAKRRWRKVVTGSSNVRVRDHVKTYEHKTPYIKFFDKLNFTLGVVHICVTEYFVIHDPARYWVWYCLFEMILLGGRIQSYRAQKLQYFLFDFCYTVNLLAFLQIFCLFKYPMLAEKCFKMGFIMSTGRTYIFPR